METKRARGERGTLIPLMGLGCSYQRKGNVMFGAFFAMQIRKFQGLIRRIEAETNEPHPRPTDALHVSWLPARQSVRFALAFSGFMHMIPLTVALSWPLCNYRPYYEYVQTCTPYKVQKDLTFRHL